MCKDCQLVEVYDNGPTEELSLLKLIKVADLWCLLDFGRFEDTVLSADDIIYIRNFVKRNSKK